MSTPIDIADAVVALLAAAELSIEIEPRRAYVPVHTLEDLRAVRVTVVPKSLAISPATRTADQRDIEIDIAVQKRVRMEGDEPAAGECDALMTLVSEVIAVLNRIGLGSVQARFIGITNDPIFDSTHLVEKHVLTSVITATYRVME